MGDDEEVGISERKWEPFWKTIRTMGHYGPPVGLRVESISLDFIMLTW